MSLSTKDRASQPIGPDQGTAEELGPAAGEGRADQGQGAVSSPVTEAQHHPLIVHEQGPLTTRAAVLGMPSQNPSIFGQAFLRK